MLRGKGIVYKPRKWADIICERSLRNAKLRNILFLEVIRWHPHAKNLFHIGAKIRKLVQFFVLPLVIFFFQKSLIFSFWDKNGATKLYLYYTYFSTFDSLWYTNPSCYVIIAISFGIYFVRVDCAFPCKCNWAEVLVNQDLVILQVGLSIYVYLDENR